MHGDDLSERVEREIVRYADLAGLRRTLGVLVRVYGLGAITKALVELIGERKKAGR